MAPVNQIDKLSKAAEKDLKTAKKLFEETDDLYNIICFHIQQYEKED